MLKRKKVLNKCSIENFGAVFHWEIIDATRDSWDGNRFGFKAVGHFKWVIESLSKKPLLIVITTPPDWTDGMNDIFWVEVTGVGVFTFTGENGDTISFFDDFFGFLNDHGSAIFGNALRNSSPVL